MKITKRQLRRIIKEERLKLLREMRFTDDDIREYLSSAAIGYHRDISLDITGDGRPDAPAIKELLQDDFLDNFGAHANIKDYENLIDRLSHGLTESVLSERGTGNPALAEEERALTSAVVNWVDKYRMVMGMDPNDFGDDRRVRRGLDDMIGALIQ